jgi:hypothetical protein
MENRKVAKKELSAKEALEFLKKNLELKVEDFQKKCLELRKAEIEALNKAEQKRLAKDMGGLGSVEGGNSMAMAEPAPDKNAKRSAAFSSYKKGKIARSQKVQKGMDPLWDAGSKPGKLADPKFGEEPGVAKLSPSSLKTRSQNLTGKSPKNPIDDLPVHKNDTLVDPKNQNDHEKRLKTIEGGQKSVLPGDKKVAEPNKSEGSGGDSKKAKGLEKNDFNSPKDKTSVAKKPKGLGEVSPGSALPHAPDSGVASFSDPPLSPLVPEGHAPEHEVRRIKTFLGSKNSPGRSGGLGKSDKKDSAVKEEIVREDAHGKETIIREEKPIEKAVGIPPAPSMPKPGGALKMSNPGGTPGGAAKSDGPMIKEVFKPSVKMRKNMDKLEKRKKLKKDMTGLAGMSMQESAPKLGAGGSITQNAAGTSSGAGMGGGPSPKTSMDMMGSKPAAAPKAGGPLGGVGKV